MTTTAAAAGTRRHTGTYPAEPRQVGLARAALAGWLGAGPQADEAILVASEFATNSVLHSSSRHGGTFTLRAEVSPDRLRIEVEDAGGPWRDGLRDDGRPHGFDVVAAIAGAGNWGIDGECGRVARPGSAAIRVAVPPPPRRRAGLCFRRTICGGPFTGQVVRPWRWRRMTRLRPPRAATRMGDRRIMAHPWHRTWKTAWPWCSRAQAHGGRRKKPSQAWL